MRVRSAMKVLAVLSMFPFLTAGCGSSEGSGGSHATVSVQLQKGGVNYAVSGLQVSIQCSGGSPLSATTDAGGKAVITVNQTGTYSLVSVTGVDVIGQPVDSEGKEFVKTGPLSSAAPYLTYTPSGTIPSVDVTGLTSADFAMPITVPAVQIVRVLAKSSWNQNLGGTSAVDVYVGGLNGNTSFAGRVLFKNISFDEPGSIIVVSDEADDTWLRMFVSFTGNYGAFIQYSGAPGLGLQIGNPIALSSTDPIIFEVAGDGDWSTQIASGNQKARKDLSASHNFGHLMATGSSHHLLKLYSDGTVYNDSSKFYRADYEVYRYTAVP